MPTAKRRQQSLHSPKIGLQPDHGAEKQAGQQDLREAGHQTVEPGGMV